MIKKEICEELIKPNNECQLMDICLNKVNELSQKNKKYHPIQLLQKAINYYIISLASHPYISKIIYKLYRYFYSHLFKNDLIYKIHIKCKYPKLKHNPSLYKIYKNKLVDVYTISFILIPILKISIKKIYYEGW